MPFDASGNFYRTGGGGPGGTGTGADIWKGDAAANIKVLASSHDIHDQDIAANGLSLCILRDGRGTPTANIPWGGRKITNLADPSADQDAATKHYVDNPDPSEHARNIKGADLDGRLNFTALSGVNGITWTYADVSWVARHSEPSKTSSRLVMNNTVAPNTTGDAVGDVFVIDDTGRINNDVGMLTSNLSWDGASWRAISPGYGTRVAYKDGVFTLSSNDVATITNKYALTTQRDWLRAKNTNGNVDLDLVKSASAKYASINSYVGTQLRWKLVLGSNDVESPTRAGSSFYLLSYDNTGAGQVSELVINRATHEATFFGDVTSGGTVTAQQNFNSVSSTCILSTASSNGQIVFRPNGPAVTTEQVIIDQSGGLTLTGANGVFAGAGVRGRIGQTGAYGSFYQNFNWNGSVLTAYAGNSVIGNLTYTCDYRIKKNVQLLGSMWDRVKSLRPISYQQKAFDVWVDDDTVRWGFMAHELQEQLDPAAASGVKDGEEVQAPNLLAIIAGLTKALQEAMHRIELLEARA